MDRIKPILIKLNNNWIDGIFLLFWSSLLISFIDDLCANLRENEFDIATCAFFIYILLAVSYTYTSWRKFNNNKIQEQELIEAISEYPLFSKQWFSVEFPALLALTIVYTPIVVLFLIVATNEDITQTIVVSDPDFQSTLDYGNLLFGIGMLAENLKEIDQIGRGKIKKLLSFLQAIGILIGVFLYMVWAVHLQEI